MTTAVLALQWIDQLSEATARSVTKEASQSRRDLRLDLGLAPSVSLDEVYQDSIAAVLSAYKEASRPGWDGYDAHPVPPATCAQALAFLKLLPSTALRPEIVPHPDGELAFEWALGTRRVLTVSVDRTGKLSYAALIGETKQYGTEFLLDSLPDAIALALRRLRSAL